MGYAIICNARKGAAQGINVLALVDRKKTKCQWWTSGKPSLILSYSQKSAADLACKRLYRNQARVVSYDEAFTTIQEQAREIMHHEASMDNELGWDGHKNC